MNDNRPDLVQEAVSERWYGHSITQNKNFMKEYCRVHNYPMIVDGDVVYYDIRNKFLGSLILKTHSPKYASFDDLVSKIMSLGKHQRSMCMEIICTEEIPQYSKNIVGQDGTFLIDLKHSEEDLWKQMDRKTRNQVRQSMKNNITCEIIKTDEDFEDWWGIYETTCQRKKLKMYPKELLSSLRKDETIARIFSVKNESGKTIAGAYILLERAPLFWLGCSDDTYSNLRPSNLLQWTIIRWCKENNYEFYDMGGGTLSKEGPSKFKEGFGGIFYPYYIYRFSRNSLMLKLVNSGFKLVEHLDIMSTY
jgi:hypothetical protein